MMWITLPSLHSTIILSSLRPNQNGTTLKSDLAKRLKKHGFKTEAEASVTNKLARGTFPATWFLAVLAALELDCVALEEI